MWSNLGVQHVPTDDLFPLSNCLRMIINFISCRNMTQTLINNDDHHDRLVQCGEPFNRECVYYDVYDLKDVAVPGGDE